MSTTHCASASTAALPASSCTARPPRCLHQAPCNGNTEVLWTPAPGGHRATTAPAPSALQTDPLPSTGRGRGQRGGLSSPPSTWQSTAQILQKSSTAQRTKTQHLSIQTVQNGTSRKQSRALRRLDSAPGQSPLMVPFVHLKGPYQLVQSTQQHRSSLLCIFCANRTSVQGLHPVPTGDLESKCQVLGGNKSSLINQQIRKDQPE